MIVDLIPRPGRLIVVRDEVADITAGGIAKTDREVELEQHFEPKATVMRVGPPRTTEYGVVISTDVVEGDRVLISNMAMTEIEVGSGDVRQTWTVVPFECVIAKIVEAEDELPATLDELRAQEADA